MPWPTANRTVEEAAEKRRRALHVGNVAHAKCQEDNSQPRALSYVVLGHANAKWQEMQAEKQYEVDLENAALYNKMQHIRSMASSSALSRPNTSQIEHLPAQHATHGHLSDTKNSVHASPQRSHASVPLGVLYGRPGRPDTADSQLGDIASLRHRGSSSNKQQPGSSPRLHPTSMWQQPLGPFITAIADGGARSVISHVPASNIQPGVGHGDHAYGNAHVLYPIRTLDAYDPWVTLQQLSQQRHSQQEHSEVQDANASLAVHAPHCIKHSVLKHSPIVTSSQPQVLTGRSHQAHAHGAPAAAAAASTAGSSVGLAYAHAAQAHYARGHTGSAPASLSRLAHTFHGLGRSHGHSPSGLRIRGNPDKCMPSGHKQHAGFEPAALDHGASRHGSSHAHARGVAAPPSVASGVQAWQQRPMGQGLHAVSAGQGLGYGLGAPSGAPETEHGQQHGQHSACSSNLGDANACTPHVEDGSMRSRVPYAPHGEEALRQSSAHACIGSVHLQLTGSGSCGDSCSMRAHYFMLAGLFDLNELQPPSPYLQNAHVCLRGSGQIVAVRRSSPALHPHVHAHSFSCPSSPNGPTTMRSPSTPASERSMRSPASIRTAVNGSRMRETAPAPPVLHAAPRVYCYQDVDKKREMQKDVGMQGF